jgi:hypothetical protein
MNVLGPRYEHRTGGYTRILKLSQPRLGDKADMSVIEYVDRPGEIRAARPPSAFQDLLRVRPAQQQQRPGRERLPAPPKAPSAVAAAALDEVFRKLGIQPNEPAFLPSEGEGAEVAASRAGEEELEDLPPFSSSASPSLGDDDDKGAKK